MYMTKTLCVGEGAPAKPGKQKPQTPEAIVRHALVGGFREFSRISGVLVVQKKCAIGV